MSKTEISAKHTPGPWRMGADLIRVHTNWRDANGEFSPENLHRNGYAKVIASIGKEDGDWREIDQQVADARLIAAAPELLEAITGLCETLEADTDLGPCIGSMAPAEHYLGLCRAAIARATGQSVK